MMAGLAVQIAAQQTDKKETTVTYRSAFDELGGN